ncbi:MBL fold metallo-hydrolase [Nonomuraea glycinis]|jgi:L-ascorbate metabolism protein UlaG (beta-lactamase superfamily)|uniref:MBL fold metallo-hydrolase n=1 Tax=Nonomuraea glycinis TaxID=2047744 RepID=UPI002E13B7B7|nr:MBL fold metallo-hydrolase [Nonomuraea glycinis]
MKLTKYGHACVRLEKNGRALVVDPGVFTADPVLDGADAVLITHEHSDHLDIDRLAAASPGLEVFTCEGVAAQLTDLPVRVEVVEFGDSFQAAGFSVKVFGEWHAKNHPDVPIVPNIGFLVDDAIFYPGDALTVPDVEVDTLLLPTNAPWLKLMEMIDYVRAVRPGRAFSTHDGLLNEYGLSLVDNYLRLEAQKQGADMRRLATGESITLG